MLQDSMHVVRCSNDVQNPNIEYSFIFRALTELKARLHLELRTERSSNCCRRRSSNSCIFSTRRNQTESKQSGVLKMLLNIQTWYLNYLSFMKGNVLQLQARWCFSCLSDDFKSAPRSVSAVFCVSKLFLENLLKGNHFCKEAL